MTTLYRKITPRATDGVVLVYVEGLVANHDIVVPLSPEGARNLIADLEEAAGVAELENDEWKAERVAVEREEQAGGTDDDA